MSSVYGCWPDLRIGPKNDPQAWPVPGRVPWRYPSHLQKITSKRYIAVSKFWENSVIINRYSTSPVPASGWPGSQYVLSIPYHSFTIYQIVVSIKKYLAFGSSVSETDFFEANNLPFPKITVCSDSIHSKEKGMNLPLTVCIFLRAYHFFAGGLTIFLIAVRF